MKSNSKLHRKASWKKNNLPAFLLFVFTNWIINLFLFIFHIINKKKSKDLFAANLDWENKTISIKLSTNSQVLANNYLNNFNHFTLPKMLLLPSHESKQTVSLSSTFHCQKHSNRNKHKPFFITKINIFFAHPLHNISHFMNK